MKILKMLLIGFLVILAPVVILLTVGALYVAWPVVLFIFILACPGLIIGYLVGNSDRKKKEQKKVEEGSD